MFDIIGKRRWYFAFSLAITIPGLLFILLTPITARIVKHLVTGGDPGVDLAAFDPLRFRNDG